MLGILVELALSWLILWIVEKKNLTVLGFYPSASRLKGFVLFFLIATACCLAEFFLRMQFFKEQYQVNPLLNFKLVWKGFLWNLISVLYEELIFRGTLLYILIRRWGAKQGIIVSALAFGIYHWFSYNLFGNVAAMIYVFIITAVMGLILAYAYAKTFSMYIAIGFHLGWNIMHGFVFSKGPIGNGVFMLAPRQPIVTVSYFTYYTVTLLPIIIAFLSSYLLVRKWRRTQK
jgi:membrane protease YdiL (CAAX protease family)